MNMATADLLADLSTRRITSTCDRVAQHSDGTLGYGNLTQCNYEVFVWRDILKHY
jgi:hypothetical protein